MVRIIFLTRENYKKMLRVGGLQTADFLRLISFFIHLICTFSMKNRLKFLAEPAKLSFFADKPNFALQFKEFFRNKIY